MSIPSSQMSYVCEYGRGKRSTLGKVGVITPDQARDKAKELLGDVVRGIDPAAAKKSAKAHNFGAYIANEYGPWVETHRKDGKATLARLKACFGEFDNKKLTDITSWIVEKWRSKRLKDGIQPATVNRDLVALKAALSKAVEWKLIEEHPLKDVKPSKVDHGGVVRFLDEPEESRLRNALDEREERIRQERDSANQWRQQRGYELLPDLRTVAFVDYLKPLVILAMNTGLRRGELLNLDWASVDLARANLTVKASSAKTGKTRHVPLNDEARDLLAGWQDQSTNTGLVFPGKDGNVMDNIKSSWGNLLKSAEVHRFRFHDLRHHFASRLVMAGVDLNTVRELLGHSDIKMTLRYAHLAPEHKAAAVALLNRKPEARVTLAITS